MQCFTIVVIDNFVDNQSVEYSIYVQSLQKAFRNLGLQPLSEWPFCMVQTDTTSAVKAVNFKGTINTMNTH